MWILVKPPWLAVTKGMKKHIFLKFHRIDEIHMYLRKVEMI